MIICLLSIGRCKKNSFNLITFYFSYYIYETDIDYYLGNPFVKAIDDLRWRIYNIK